MLKTLKHKYFIFFTLSLFSISSWSESIYRIKPVEISSDSHVKKNSISEKDLKNLFLNETQKISLKPITVKSKVHHLSRLYEVDTVEYKAEKPPQTLDIADIVKSEKLLLNPLVNPTFFPLRGLKPDFEYLEGNLKLADSLNIDKTDRVEIVFNSFKDFDMEGEFSYKDLQYKVPLSDSVGEIRVNVFNSSGYKKAQGKKIIHSRSDLRKPLLVFPYSDKPTLRIESALSFKGNKIYEKNASAYLYFLQEKLEQGPLSFLKASFLEKNSSYIMHTVFKEHWDTLTFGFSESKKSVKLFRNQTMKALYDLTQKTDLYENTGAIFGTVFFQGKPVKDAQLEISGLDESAVYFREPVQDLFLPDVSLNSTKANGRYTFTGVPKGVYGLRVVYNNQYFPAGVVKVDPQSVAYLNFDLSKKHLIQLKMFDFLNKDKILAGQVSVLGVERAIDFKKTLTASLSLAQDFTLIDLKSKDINYLPLRMVYFQNQAFFSVPLFSISWLEKTFSLSLDEGGGVIGSLSKDIRDLRLISDSGEDYSSFIYFFNPQGERVYNPHRGGGFVISRLPAGLYSLYSESEKGIFQQIIPVEEKTFFYSPF